MVCKCAMNLLHHSLHYLQQTTLAGVVDIHNCVSKLCFCVSLLVGKRYSTTGGQWRVPHQQTL